jgi:hypothetical protein
MGPVLISGFLACTATGTNPERIRSRISLRTHHHKTGRAKLLHSPFCDGDQV